MTLAGYGKPFPFRAARVRHLIKSHRGTKAKLAMNRLKLRQKAGLSLLYQWPHIDEAGTTSVILSPTAQPLYLSIASRREAGEVKDASQPGPPLGH
jgi:hypothetical protein